MSSEGGVAAAAAAAAAGRVLVLVLVLGCCLALLGCVGVSATAVLLPSY
jgi:hypothetical protein